MDMIQLMMDEHQNILKMIQIVRSAMIKFMTEDTLVRDDIENMFDFVKNYADKHHHGKEEIFLFNEMITEIGPTADKLITHGMLVEHDFGRLYVANTLAAVEAYFNGEKEKKIDIISNAIAYGELLQRHIDKEDRVVFTLARRELSENLMEEINEKSIIFEEENEERCKKYLGILADLEIKYL